MFTSIRAAVNRPLRTVGRRWVSDGTPGSLAHQDVTVNTDISPVQLAFDQFGSNTASTPLVFLHGLFGSRANNRSICKQLASRLNTRVFALDLRNHGGSPHAEPHSYPAMAADLAHWIGETCPEKPPVVLGHSMGAKAAMALSLTHPELVSALVAIDNAPRDFTAGSTGFSKFGRYLATMQKIEHANCKSLKECDKILATVEPMLPIRQFLLTNMRASDEHDGAYRCRMPLQLLSKELDNVSSWPYTPTQSRYTGPSLFIRGTQSPYVSDDAIESIAAFFPMFTLLDIDAGHWVPAEKPREFMDGVMTWLDRIDVV